MRYLYSIGISASNVNYDICLSWEFKVRDLSFIGISISDVKSVRYLSLMGISVSNGKCVIYLLFMGIHT